MKVSVKINTWVIIKSSMNITIVTQFVFISPWCKRLIHYKVISIGDFPGGAVVKDPSSSAGENTLH